MNLIAKLFNSEQSLEVLFGFLSMCMVYFISYMKLKEKHRFELKKLDKEQKHNIELLFFQDYRDKDC